MKIGDREVGPGHPAYLIAEVGSNHGGSLVTALALITAAADAGADAVKFQRFRVDDFLVPRENPEALRKYELPDAWLPDLAILCDFRGVHFLCTAFDETSLDVIDHFVFAHKVGSYEAGSALLPAAHKKGKPVIVSEGLVKVMPHPDFVRLTCVSKYPAMVTDYELHEREGLWGVSDHTLDPLTVPVAAVAVGACVVEKHLRGDTFIGSPDEVVSVSPGNFARMVAAIRRTEKVLA